jgi:hypothetical protein
VSAGILVGELPRSDARGHLTGTVHNGTGKLIDGLRLAIKTATWDRTFDVKVKAGVNTTVPFSFFVGEPGIEAESYRLVRPPE